jgi:hypothetical protein
MNPCTPDHLRRLCHAVAIVADGLVAVAIVADV